MRDQDFLVLHFALHYPYPMARTVTIRLPDDEAATLAAYAKKTRRTRTDILRAYIRSLARKRGKLRHRET